MLTVGTKVAIKKGYSLVPNLPLEVYIEALKSLSQVHNVAQNTYLYHKLIGIQCYNEFLNLIEVTKHNLFADLPVYLGVTDEELEVIEPVFESANGREIMEVWLKTD